MRRALAMLLAAVWGCAPAPPARLDAPSAGRLPTPPRAAAVAEPVEAIEVLGPPGVALTLSPLQQPRAVSVAMQLHGSAAELSRLQLARCSPAALDALRARDAGGAIAIDVQAEGKGCTLSLRRAPASPLSLSYRVAAATDVDAASPLAVAVDPERMRLAGESTLALPAAFDGRGVQVALHIDDRGLRGRGSASSFGVGPTRRFSALGRELREASFVAGGMGTAVLDAPDGHDEAAWLGYTSFDPRQAIGDLASFRSALGRVLGQPDATPVTYLFVADARASGEFTVAGRAASVLVSMGVGQPYSGSLRIAIATALVQRWIGRMLWIGPHGADEAQAFWFSDGVARFVARELLLEYGLIAPAEYLAEVNGQLATLATSELRGASNVELARSASRAAALSVLVARGSLYATELDAVLSRHDVRLLSVLAGLLRRAVAERRPLPVDAWLEALAPALGAEAPAQGYQRWIERGESPPLASNALGPCFRAQRARYPLFSLGFDLAASQMGERTLVGLEPKGPAARAGLRAGDVLSHASFRGGRSDEEARVTVEREGESKTFRYLPVGGSRPGQAFSRVAGVDDDACAK